ncbi:MAG: tRNA preQ1(34) S-adenosylmethionine ribosyltransferase-isomerase QueA [Planctomycetes bacterium]|nr:tRNA preQ1(34) S-adenosylmethionine ribosyltransferase-isomerase QueA [Planctomycetota bacterium]
MLRTSDLEYHLPPELIATQPAARRDDARMMVLPRDLGNPDHHSVRDLPSYLNAGDLLVLNQTRVVPARVVGKRCDTGGAVEGLYLGVSADNGWSMMLRSNGRLRAGQRIELVDADDQPSGIHLELVSPPAAETGNTWHVIVEGGQGPAAADDDTLQILNRVGRTPLPPYILKARQRRADHDESRIADAEDRSMYQTVYATEPGSVAAPTAGLHFTDHLLGKLVDGGVRIAKLTLHVGAGTFKPITAEYVQQHAMHREWYSVPGSTLDAIANARQAGGRIVAVGTTSVRCLESLDPECLSVSGAAHREVTGTTDLLITPGYPFRLVDGLLTNFHLPCSTLLALVGAFVGLERLLSAYRIAVDRRYRFYSYGDCMLIPATPPGCGTDGSAS